jgi:hypothetical protein
MTTIKHGLGRKVVGTKQIDDFSYTLIDTFDFVSPSISYSVNADANIKTTTSQGLKSDYKITVNPSWLSGDVTFLSKSPNVASVDEYGQVKWVSNGQSEINIKTKVGTKRVSRHISLSSNSAQEVDSWVEGSLARHVTDAVQSMIIGKSVSALNSNWYDTSRNIPPAYQEQYPNPNRITGGLNLNAISIGWWKNMVLISPRHVIGSHLSGTGAIKFHADDGSIIERNVIAISPFNTNDKTEADKNFVGLLDAAIPLSGAGSIKPMAILPPNYASKLALARTTEKIPVLRKKQAGGNKVEILDATLSDSNFFASARLLRSERLPFSDWTSHIESGDSNGAVFIPIDVAGGTNYQAILVSSINNTQGGRNYAVHFNHIQTLMNGLLEGYTLPVVDLTAFTGF